MMADRRKTRVLGKAFLAGLSQPLANRSTLLGYAVFFVMPPIVLAGVWKTAALANGGSIVGYSADALVWYIAISETAVLTVRNRLIEEIGIDIGSGRLEVEMQRPVSPLPLRLVNEFGLMAPRFGLGLCLACVVALSLGGLPPSLAGLIIAVPALALALILNVVVQYIFASAAFWIREAKGAWFLYNKLVFVLGGMLLPLEVLPAWLETPAKLMPFMAMAYVPARLAAGFWEPHLLAVQCLWLVVGYLAAVRVFDRGQHRLMRADR